MKIYFEDGKLRDTIDEVNANLELDAKHGYSFCENVLCSMKTSNPNSVVYTNVITALRNEFAWNNKFKIPEIYIRNKNGIFTRIDKLTNRELREGHNIMRMYIAGEFDNEV